MGNEEFLKCISDVQTNFNITNILKFLKIRKYQFFIFFSDLKLLF